MAWELDSVSETDARDIINFYFEVKSLVSLAEIEDEEQRLCVPAITELRNALDHLMRIGHVCVNHGRDATNSGLIDDDDPRPRIPSEPAEQKHYCEINFSKIKGHLFRAAYDALDILVLSSLLEFRYVVRNYDFDDICKVISNWPTQASNIEAAQRLIKRCKMYKDVVGNQDDQEVREDINRDVVEQYLGAYHDIKKAIRLIQKNSLEIRAAVRARKRETRKTILISLLASIIAAVVIATGVWLARFLPSPKPPLGVTKINQQEVGQPPASQQPIQSTGRPENARN